MDDLHLEINDSVITRDKSQTRISLYCQYAHWGSHDPFFLNQREDSPHLPQHEVKVCFISSQDGSYRVLHQVDA